jgi:hypothetical protein
MTSVQRWFSRYIKIRPIPVSVASGAVVYAIGQVTIVFNAGEMGYICLDDVLHIPQLNKSLISVSRLIDRGVQVEFNENGVHLEKNEVNFLPHGMAICLL